MGHNFSETNIDLNSEFVAPKSISDFLAEISAIDDSSQKLSKLNFLLQSLEDEANKIDAIRRELPLSIRLLSDAIEMVRGEALKLKGKEKFPAMEEFIPLKGNSEGGERAKGSIDQGEKKNWMSSSLLLNNPVTYDNFNIRKPSNQLFPKKPGDVVEGIQLFVPSKRKAAAVNAEEGPAAKKYGLPVHGLSLSPPAPPSAAAEKVAGDCDGSKMSKQEQRKQRRCWSPELHQRFVNALEKLCGAQAATPKQIREIMNVDGLTNDEVKSHLQKYRLHVRRLTKSPPSSCSTWQQPYRVINALTEKARTGAQSGSPEGPLQLGLPGTREVSVTVTGLNAVAESEEEESVRG